ncbi:type II toxin-antitoxin system VapC family toxin [uncultured Meiothermus sp.]|jgi:ribonuclease VapC|uniref:type II toxin-antitoxin system VapC family toxin n=1 Tax=uncultured Meiothermus sp. TaxID=157471 RepID=UPI00260F2B28|nr:type II toxin-antitoxin system VapC family toxin [uncultured Meiothermus sp.]
MVLDSSVLLHILFREPGYLEVSHQLNDASQLFVGAPTLVEAVVVLVRREGEAQALLLEDLLCRLRVEVVPFAEEHYREALLAFRRYGKGRHPAALNFGDCLSYAAARVAGLPLAYVGDDVAQTDLA